MSLFKFQMRIFRIFSPVVLVIIAAIVVYAYAKAPTVHFDAVRAICYGYLIGWFGAWFSVWFWSRRWSQGQTMESGGSEQV
jgi:uncharacterized membrane protein YfcA